MLEGSVRSSGKTVRVTVQRVRADNGYPMCLDTYDRPLDDIFRIQDDIAVSVVNGLKVPLLGGQLPRAARTANTEAYTLYLQSEAIAYFGVSSVDYAHGHAAVDQALKLDPSLAVAFQALGRL